LFLFSLMISSRRTCRNGVMAKPINTGNMNYHRIQSHLKGKLFYFYKNNF
jgi:hypothetical protein